MADDETALRASGESALFRFTYNLRRRRQVLNLTQSELADRIQAMGGSLYQQTIAKIESRARGVSLDEAVLLARALDLSIEQLLVGPVTDAPEGGELAQLSARADEAVMGLTRANDEYMMARSAMEEAQVRLRRAEQVHAVAAERAAEALGALAAAFEQAKAHGQNDRTISAVAKQLNALRGQANSEG